MQSTWLLRSQPLPKAACFRNPIHRCSIVTRTNSSKTVICQAGCRAPFIPSVEAERITEAAAQSILEQYEQIPVHVPCYPQPVMTAVVPPQQGNQKTPVVLLHGFDSSSLEFRRLLPELQQDLSPWAVDLIGWGFTDCGFGDSAGGTSLPLGPEEKRQHLYSLWQRHVGTSRQRCEQLHQDWCTTQHAQVHKIGRPMVLLGASLGATIAMDFAIAHPEAVSHLVLLCPQVNSDGVPTLPRPLAWLGVQVLKAVPLRQYANKLAYYDHQKYATEDALLCGRLHTHLPGWVNMNIAFIQSGGYKIVGRLKDVVQPTLIVWGRHDQILDPRDAPQVVQQFANGTLVWAENSGHCPHLEEAVFTAQIVKEFVKVASPAQV